ncbi:hypothetical protein SanJ4211_1351c [Streptococcus anginosus]|uniref:hypothetical protein n=1 Tax=Streptococcus anginosus TaxID=1328 RepID=UPI000705968D|nr:hypothetical protein [Streptococcus anginosus]ALL03438.1 hypothetical protein SanJ4211_1351c [Streptococcus anginosus]QBX31741.1 hypothetical protein Javan74_0005 [Streptococcus phage Javan74]
MNENVYTYMFTDLKNQIGDKALEAAEFKARLIQEQAEKEQLQEQLKHFNAVLASDEVLKELFEEAKTKLEGTNEI